MEIHLVCLKLKKNSLLLGAYSGTIYSSWLSLFCPQELPTAAEFSFPMAAHHIFEDDDHGQATFAHTVFQLKYSPSMTVKLPTHSPLPFSARITQRLLCLPITDSSPAPFLHGCLSRSEPPHSVKAKMPSVLRCTVTCMYHKKQTKTTADYTLTWHQL